MADDKNKAQPQTQNLSITKEELAEMMTMSSMAAAQAIARELNPRPTEAQVAARTEGRGQCRDCGQVRAACKGKHKKVVLFPRNEEYSRFFQGVTINGITYRSENGNQTVTVPEDANVEHMMAAWEKQENVLITGRKASHNSGSIGQAGTNGYVPAHGGWR